MSILWAERARCAGTVLDTLLPPRCLCCGSPVWVQGQLCGSCFGMIDFIGEPSCERCGVPISALFPGGGRTTCSTCFAVPPRYGRARAALQYNPQARQLILPFKHSDRLDLASALASRMAHAGRMLLCYCDILIPVPLHRTRLFWRRYNQAALLAQALSRITTISVTLDALVRCHVTESLGEKSAGDRAAIVCDAFAVWRHRRDLIADRKVVLVDDVMTSGATANACATALLGSGVQSVDVLVAARVPDPRSIY